MKHKVALFQCFAKVVNTHKTVSRCGSKKYIFYHNSNWCLDSFICYTKSKTLISWDYEKHHKYWCSHLDCAKDIIFCLYERYEISPRRLDKTLLITCLFWQPQREKTDRVQPNGNIDPSCSWLNLGQDVWLWPWPVEESHLWAGIHASLSGDHWPPTVILLNCSPCNRQHRGYNLCSNISKLYSSSASAGKWKEERGKGASQWTAASPFGLSINFQIHLFTRWRPSVWFKAQTPINTILTCYHKVAAVDCQRWQMGSE